MRQKAVSPAHRRAVAQELVKNQAGSQRAACRILRLARSTFKYRGRAPTPKEEQLRKRLLELSVEHPRNGYRRIAALLRREGWRVGKRHIQRLRRAEGLRVPPTKKKVIRGGSQLDYRRQPRIGIMSGHGTLLPTQRCVGELWSC